MQIGIADSLRESLDLGSYAQWTEYGAEDTADPLFCWDALMMEVEISPWPQYESVSILLMTNVSNRFSVVATLRYQADTRLLKDAFKKLIRHAFALEGFTQEATDAYLEAAGPIMLGRTHGKRALGHMRNAMSWVYASAREYERDGWFQEEMTRETNRYRCKCLSFENESSAKRWMAHDLIRHGIQSPLTDTSYDIGQAHPKDPASRSKPQKRPLRPEDLPGPGEDACEICGRRATVYHINQPLCRGCHNKMMEDELGLDHFDDEGITISGKHPDGTRARFEVERVILGHLTVWTAREIPTKLLIKGHPGYVGLELSINEPHDARPKDSIKRLTDKVHKALENPSTTAFDECRTYSWGSSSTEANKTGWARIDYDRRTGKTCFICDGIAYTADQFLNLLSSYEGFNLAWQILDQSEDLPVADSSD